MKTPEANPSGLCFMNVLLLIIFSQHISSTQMTGSQRNIKGPYGPLMSNNKTSLCRVQFTSHSLIFYHYCQVFVCIGRKVKAKATSFPNGFIENPIDVKIDRRQKIKKKFAFARVNEP